MTRVYHLTGTLGATAAAKQLSLLLPHLGDGHHVGTLGSLDPFAAKLGVPVTPFRVRNLVDVPGLNEVRAELKARRPAVVHAWGTAAIRVVGVLRRTLGFRCHVVVTDTSGRRTLPVSRPLTLTFSPEAGERGLVALLSRRLLGRATDFPVPRAVCPAEVVDREAVRASLGIPAGFAFIAASGGFDHGSGLRDAVWAFDILKYAAPTARLVLVGDGPGRAAVERFQNNLGFDDDRVIFAGLRRDAPAVFAAADLFWTAAKVGGFNAAAEAVAAGTPVIGFANSDLHGLPMTAVPTGDKPALAKATYAFLADPPPRTVPDLSQFAVAPLVSALLRVYDSPTA